MITIAYDPVAGELLLDLGEGHPAVALPAAALCAKFYGNAGMFSCTFDTDVIDVNFDMDCNDPGRVVVTPVGASHWRVRLEYVNAAEPG